MSVAEKVIGDWVARLCFEYLKTPCRAASGSLKRMKRMNDSKKKGGRPRLPDYRKKTKCVLVRFTSVDLIYLRSCADECGLPLAEYICRAAMHQQTTALLTKEEMTAIADIRNIGNNLNQITRSVHLGTVREREVRKIIDFITGILRKLR